MRKQAASDESGWVAPPQRPYLLTLVWSQWRRGMRRLQFGDGSQLACSHRLGRELRGFDRVLCAREDGLVRGWVMDVGVAQ